MNELKVGQVLVLKIRFNNNNNGDISDKNHPYLIIDIDKDWNIVEIAQIDSLEGKEYKSMFKSNKTIYCKGETVIDKDSFVQLDNSFRLEYFDDLIRFRKRNGILSQEGLNAVISAYNEYHDKYKIDEMKNVYIDKDELLSLNV